MGGGGGRGYLLFSAVEAAVVDEPLLWLGLRRITAKLLATLVRLGRLVFLVRVVLVLLALLVAVVLVVLVFLVFLAPALALALPLALLPTHAHT